MRVVQRLFSSRELILSLDFDQGADVLAIPNQDGSGRALLLS